MKQFDKVELKKGHWYLWTRKGKQHIIKRRWWRQYVKHVIGEQLIDLTDVSDIKPYITYESGKTLDEIKKERQYVTTNPHDHSVDATDYQFHIILEREEK